MHELSLALSIVEVAEKEAAEHAGKATAVHLRLGALSGVVKEALLSAWELARSNSPLEQATLIVEEVPVVAWCPRCRGECGIVSMQQFCCSNCGEPVAEVMGGRELEIVALELET